MYTHYEIIHLLDVYLTSIWNLFMYKSIIDIYLIKICSLEYLYMSAMIIYHNEFSLFYLSQLFPYHCQKEISIFGHLFYKPCWRVIKFICL